jgi:hypothetical protein
MGSALLPKEQEGCGGLPPGCAEIMPEGKRAENIVFFAICSISSVEECRHFPAPVLCISLQWQRRYGL